LTPSALMTPAAGTPPAPTTSCGCNCAKWVVWAIGSPRCVTGCKVWGVSSRTQTSMLASGRAGLKPRLAGLRGDIHSLIEYEEQLSSKVQFVLDALVGLIGIAQNDVFKVLTIVSIVGIPPTLMAGIYGMNFKNMPEYDWAWGYQYGWTVIILSALIPLVWFKLKGWF
jgi:magnesium transporter